MFNTNRKAFSLAGLALLALFMTLFLATGTSQAAATGLTYGGQATVLDVSVLGLGVTVADTGPLPAEGGFQEAGLLTASVTGVATAQVPHAVAVGGIDVFGHPGTYAEASITELDLTVGGNSIQADVVANRAWTYCADYGGHTGQRLDIDALVVNGEPLQVTLGERKSVRLPNGWLHINEISFWFDAAVALVSANALRVVLDTGEEVVVNHVRSEVYGCDGLGPYPPPPVQECLDIYVTASGRVDGTPSGGTADLAAAVEIDDGVFDGHLIYIESGDHIVELTGVIEYHVVGDTTLYINGLATVNGVPGVGVEITLTDGDGSDIGTDDIDHFEISVADGYRASGIVTGEIELHLCGLGF
jgi:hypothetical protein